MKFKTTLTLSLIGAILALSGCSHKKTKPTEEPTARVSEAKPGQIGSTENSAGRSPIETNIPSVTEKRIQADINHMTPQDFMQLGLNSDVAQKVVEYRNDHGAFKSVDELKNVPGMDSVWLSQMHSRLAVG